MKLLVRTYHLAVEKKLVCSILKPGAQAHGVGMDTHGHLSMYLYLEYKYMDIQTSIPNKHDPSF